MHPLAGGRAAAAAQNAARVERSLIGAAPTRDLRDLIIYGETLMKTTTRAALTALLTASIAYSMAYAQQPAPERADRSERARAAEDRHTGMHARLSSEEFAEKAAAAGHAEVAMGKLGVEKAQTAAVRAYAQKMVSDHTKGNQELTAAAQKKGIELPSSPDAMHKVMHKKFEMQKADAEFDQDFMKQMVKDHEATVALFEAATQADDVDPELKALAQKKLPTLRAHLSEAQQLARQTER
jgi:putative membrane protein